MISNFQRNFQKQPFENFKNFIKFSQVSNMQFSLPLSSHDPVLGGQNYTWANVRRIWTDLSPILCSPAVLSFSGVASINQMKRLPQKWVSVWVEFNAPAAGAPLCIMSSLNWSKKLRRGLGFDLEVYGLGA